MEQEYWVVVRENEAARFNPRAKRIPLKGGLVKVWYGNGVPSRTAEEDREGIRNNLSKDGITPVRITTR
ncbi:hypothetical protein A2397_00890 [Candidatus Amesbacteria bacterium RIFOXYB1_FULL_44_23]|uniref:NusG-like N-terminal domain-containing protein n=1 Tax=Candidatus Amesbacteria bacterium RIFOXYB1_FULL_44_23 TaxID=1797263 RepID=A0A1F4ZU11_9BACT|nr:MAG: hypothetical protein A2397_00890 [Candidatus Amesbacteria bacterium RIFOXYB1_FULL_44_23]